MIGITGIIARTKTYIVVLLAVLVCVAWVLYLGSRPVRPDVSDDQSPVRVAIARGSSAGTIGKVLADNKVIRSPLVFSITCRAGGVSARLKPGVYEFSQSMTVREIVQRLTDGESLESRVTIPEGFTVKQIGDLLGEKSLVESEIFVGRALAHGKDLSAHPFIYSQNLEGYLFPDTYIIARGTDSDGIINKMLDAFQQKVAVPYRGRVEKVAYGRLGIGEDSFPQGLHKILTLASMVEREAKVDKDRPIIAAVLWNRLKKNMKLEIDATVTYSPGQSKENKSKVYYKDLQNGSDYNTYRNPGLPPGPICNPGVASIEAVLYPASVDYLYYVAKKDGSHVFSRTYEEHQAARRAIKNGGS